jgi:hypothetical protein
MKLLRPLAGYTLYDHKTKDYISRELQITGIFDKIDEYGRNWLLHLQRMPQNRIPLKSYRFVTFIVEYCFGSTEQKILVSWEEVCVAGLFIPRSFEGD